MTIEAIDIGIYLAVCDECGDTIALDTTTDQPIEDALEELKDLGWRIDKPETATFHTGPAGTDKYKQVYEHHACKTCSED